VRAQAGRKVHVWWSKSREEPLARTSSVTPSIKIKSNFRGYKRVDTIFRAGLPALLFFCFERVFALAFFRDIFFEKFFLSENVSNPFGSRRGGRNGAN
jgi:hypothetical protein